MEIDHYLDDTWLTLVFGYSLVVCVLGVFFEVIFC